MTGSKYCAGTTRTEDAQVLFEVGDRVRFMTADRGTLAGTVEKLNPKRARVRCGNGVGVVPYTGLEHLCSSTAENRKERAKRLKEVAARARELMDQHGLNEWTLRFSAARKKLGECRARQKLILLSRAHAVNGAPGAVTDTILHEIAHALAGSAAGHGPAWKATARRLGAIPKSCAPESDEARRTREAARTMFRTGDAVAFIARGKLRTGTIVRMNPKRARVKCGDVMWSVPYARISGASR
ncbi:SprT-like domain-containing protein [Candidatus Rariloculus sp.]|uniref:SprT-like domain-containing protein n=1 Tax=Candidatus Rariloculus sp. TaxID=3101265 RepID=UPI003D0CDC4F